MAVFSAEGSWSALLNRRMVICVFTGFASGLPLYLIIQLVPAWLRQEGVGLAEIGFFTAIQFPYTWKFLWAPVLDRYALPFLGRRRGWLLVVQLALIASVIVLGVWNPADQLLMITAASALVAFFSATQDIVIDAYRRELLTSDADLAMGNVIHTQAYRVAGLVPGSLGLILADHVAWSAVFTVMAGFMVVGVLMTLLISEAVKHPKVPPSLAEVAREAIGEFFGRKGVGGGCLFLAFLLLYKLGDSMATALSTPFYLDLGFTNTEIGVVAKNAALWPSIIGGVLGGLLITRIGINRGLWLFGVVQVVTIMGFVWLAEVGHNLYLLGGVIAFEYLGVGLGTAAFVGFIARETNPAMAATQFALFTAITSIPRTMVNAATGILVEQLGWSGFFVLCTVLALPGMALLPRVAPFNAAVETGDTADDETDARSP